MPTIPASTKTSVQQRLTRRARERWPQILQISTRFHGQFCYIHAAIDGDSDDQEELRLCRLRYGGSASRWGFAIYRASHDDYDDSYLPTGLPTATPEDALDTACGLYLADPTAWTLTPPTN